MNVFQIVLDNDSSLIYTEYVYAGKEWNALDTVFQHYGLIPQDVIVKSVEIVKPEDYSDIIINDIFDMKLSILEKISTLPEKDIYLGYTYE